jgi:hypothetical protein
MSLHHPVSLTAGVLVPTVDVCTQSSMAVRLGKYSQSLCISAQKYMLCAKILVVLRRNKVTAQKSLYTCAEITSVRRNVSCAPKS